MRPQPSRACALAVLALAFSLTACGNRGDLDPPPGAMTTNAEGERVEAPRPDRPFILDPLL